MWNGRGTLAQLVEELERQKNSKIDFVADTRQLVYGWEDDGVVLKADADGTKLYLGNGCALGSTALSQAAMKSDPQIPEGFLKALLKKDGNHGVSLMNRLMGLAPDRRLIRLMDGKVRAILSDRYRVMDHFDMAFAALATVKTVGGSVIEASLTEDMMRIRFTTQTVWDVVNAARESGGFGSKGNSSVVGRSMMNMKEDLPGGPGTVYPLVTLSNSETGRGGVKVRFGILQGICLNGMILDTAIDEIHLGQRMEVGAYSMKTQELESKSISSKIDDVLRIGFSSEGFKKLCEKARKASENEIQSPTTAVQNIVKATGLNEEERNSILEFFLKDYRMTQYGLAQAVGRTAQDTENPDRSEYLEEVAGRVMNNARLYEVEA